MSLRRPSISWSVLSRSLHADRAAVVPGFVAARNRVTAFAGFRKTPLYAAGQFTHADKWRPERPRAAYTTDGRLAFDVDASLRGMPAAEHPDAALLALRPSIEELITALDRANAAAADAEVALPGDGRTDAGEAEGHPGLSDQRGIP